MIITFLIIGLFITVGAAFDQFSYKKEKLKVYYKMVNWGMIIQNLKFYDIHIKMIDWLISSIERNLKEKKILYIPLGLTASYIIFFTTFLSLYLQHRNDFNVFSNRADELVALFYGFYNLIFNIVSIILTYRILKHVKNKNRFVGIIGIFCDIIVAYILVVSFYSTAITVTNNYYNKRTVINQKLALKHGDPYNLNIKLTHLTYDTIISKKSSENLVKNGFDENANVYLEISYSGFYENIKEVNNFIKNLFIKNGIFSAPKYNLHIEQNNKKKIFKNIISFEKEYSLISGLSVSIFIPTIIYLSLLFILYVSKDIIIIGQLFSIRFFRTATETITDDITKFRPGLHFGILLSLILAIIKAITALI